MKYSAIGLNDGIDKGRVAGEIELTYDTLIFRYHEQEVRLNINRTTLTQGGTGNRFIYFKDRANADWTIYTDDKSILKRQEIINKTNLKEAVSKIKNSRNIFKLSVISIAALLVFLVIGFFLFRGPVIKIIAQSIPASWERELSSTMMESILVGQNVISDVSISERLNLITKPLTEGLGDSNFEFTFTIIEDSTLNAFALPGGDIVIHSGLILEADNVNEVVGVLAHEICHVTQRHHLRGLLDKVGFFVVVRTILGDASGVGAELAMAGATLESLKYSRNYENEADEAGWSLLLKSNLNPNGMIGFFKKLAEEHETVIDNEALDAIASYLSTHPDTKNRIKTLESKEKSNIDYTDIELNFEEFQEDLKDFISKEF